jgi:hypothetical protein
MAHCYAAFTETDRLIGGHAPPDGGRRKNDCAEIIASGTGDDMAHCYAAFTETVRLIGNYNPPDGGRRKNDCVETIASSTGNDMTHCYAAFTETDRLVGKTVSDEGSGPARWNNDSAEIIANGNGSDMVPCYSIFTETDGLVGKCVAREGGCPDHLKNDCAEVIAGGGGGDMKHCYAAFTETHCLVEKTVPCEGWVHSESNHTNATFFTGGIAGKMTRGHAVFNDITHLSEKVFAETDRFEAAVSGGTNNPVHVMCNTTEDIDKLATHLEGWSNESHLVDVLLKRVSAAIDNLVGHGIGDGTRTCISTDTPCPETHVAKLRAAATDENYERAARELSAGISHFLSQSEAFMQRRVPVHCRSASFGPVQDAYFPVATVSCVL